MTNLNEEQKEALNKAKQEEKPTTAQRIENLEKEIEQASTQIQEWNCILLKKTGAIEMLQQIEKENDN